MLPAPKAHLGTLVVLGLAVVLASAAVSRAAEPAPITPEAAKFFESKVRPVLVESCLKCHGPDKQRGNLRLDSRQALLAGGDLGPGFVPGKPEDSLLIKAIRYQETSLQMPPKKRLPKAQVEDLAAWIKMGSPWPGSAGPAATVRNSEVRITDRDREHWAFRPIRRPAPPVKSANPIDAFVRAGLESKGLAMNPPAGKRELIRRAFFDLIGLPPTPEEVEAFVAEPAAEAYERLIDDLLARPQYGERWGRHWLDLVRFAQTNGYERDDEKPWAWRYRDYVIRSFNLDLPYDRFILEQLAGDELKPVGDEGLMATVFYRLGVWDDEPDDKRQAEFDNLDDVVSTLGETFLGLTVGCARCHDHKFDPFSQEDYYSLLAFVRNIKPYAKPSVVSDAGIFRKLQGGDLTLAVQEVGPKPQPTQVLLRGNAATPGKEVQPRFPLVLCPPGREQPALEKPAGTDSTGLRLTLARWIAGKDNPLTARVIVNRVWMHHFGKALVATPSDFGKNGAKPTHPELLDFLAGELIEGGWKLKRLHRQIMLSDAYRQSSAAGNDKGQLVDPGNTLLWRQNLRRLEAESIRDSVLAVSGRLNLKMGGRGIFPRLPAEVLATQSRPGNGWGKAEPGEEDRRSVYIFVKRTLLVPLLESLDFATPDKSVAVRTTTTIAPQALILLNSQFMEEQAQAFADRLLALDGNDPGYYIDQAFRIALGRKPTPREKSIARGYLERNEKQTSYREALAQLCKLVLNLNEFVYVD